MKKIHKIHKQLFILATIITLVSCNKSKLELQNPNDVALDKFYTSEQDALVGLSGVFDGFQYREMVGRDYRQLEIPSDNAQVNGGLADWLEIETSNHTSSNLLVENMWAYLYNIVSRANLAISKVGQMAPGTISDASRKRIIAEASFLRAHAYLDLTSLYGDIPFYTTPVGIFDPASGKTPKTAIYTFIIADLLKSIPNLPATVSGSERGRITSWAAKALLGKFYLYKQDWPNAATQFKDIINSNAYSLFPSYSKLFTPDGEYSSENLFEIGFIEGGTDNGENFSSQVDTTLAPIIPLTNYRPSESLVNSYPAIDGRPIAGTNKSPLYVASKPYENRDPRLRASIYTTSDFSPVDGRKYWNYSNSNKFAIKKYSWYSKVQYAANQGPQNYYMIRYADVLLMYAEAQNEAVGPDASVYSAVTAVRKRAGLQAGTGNLYGLKAAMTQAEMRTAIRDERRWELALEHQRYFDLKRWGIIETVINTITPNPRGKKFTAPRDLLWPYPLSEMDNNQALKKQGQNPGW